MPQTSPFVYIPTLHKELLPPRMPEDILTLWPGLPGDAGTPSVAVPGWFVPQYSYTRQEVTACLADLRSLDEESLALFSEDLPKEAALRPGEAQDLARFAQSGMAADTSDAKQDQTAVLKWAQRFLLLAWVQEERVLEMESLAQRYRDSARKLALQLGEDTELGEQETSPEESVYAGLLTSMQELFPDDVSVLLPSWRFMIDVMGAVLPPDAVLCTADARVRSAVEEIGLQPQEVTPEIQAQLPEAWRTRSSSVAWLREPLWRVLGKQASLPGKPWLDASPLFLFVTEPL